MSLRLSLDHGLEGARRTVERGDLAVVVDALRATSTIATALAVGFERVVCTRVTDRSLLPSDGVTAGERDGITLPGFDHGNSPLELAARKVPGRTLYLSTTNGTAVIEEVAASVPTLAGSLLNASAVAVAAAERALREGRGVTLLTSGYRGWPAFEDTLAATLLGDAVPRGRFAGPLEPIRVPDVERAFAECDAGRRLASLGLADDVRRCAQRDRLTVVPIFEDGAMVSAGSLRAGASP